jgi:hypothetical protein
MLKETILPANIRRDLEALGVILEDRQPKPPRPVREYKYQMPNLNEKGEPDF